MGDVDVVAPPRPVVAFFETVVSSVQFVAAASRNAL